MAVGDAYLEKADAFLMDLFAGWNVLTTILATVVIFYIAYPLLTGQDPDTHPLLLARQATASPVRKSGESAIYRSLETPYGYPLRSGLNVKDPGAPRWASGRTGDLRDVWKQAVQGPLNDDGTPIGKRGKLMTILGREQVLEHDFDSVSQEINVIGQHIKSANGKVVAVCLSNSREMLAAIFASAFYGFRAVLVPHHLETKDLIAHLSLVKPDFLIAEAGALELAAVSKSCSSLDNVIWVAKYGNRHMDWNEVPEGVGGKMDVAVWHELIDDKKSLIDSELPTVEKDSVVAPLVLFYGDSNQPKVVEYTSENIASAIAAQISALPRPQRLSTSDTILPASTLCSIYPLTLTFAALYSGSTVAVNSVAGEFVDVRLTATGISPTVIIASSTALSNSHEQQMSSQTGLLDKLNHSIQSQSLDTGNMPQSTTLSKLAVGGSAAVEPAFAKLRLIYAGYDTTASATKPPMTTQALADLRVILGARIVYALTTPAVTGAVTQTNVFDYRRSKDTTHFGVPLSSVEIRVVGDEANIAKDNPDGKIRVAGPAVVNGEITLDVEGRLNDDATLSVI